MKTIFEIIQSVKDSIKHKLTFCLYENTTAEAVHCVGRDPEEYLNLLAEVFTIESSDFYKHDSNHSLLVASVV